MHTFWFLFSLIKIFCGGTVNTLCPCPWASGMFYLGIWLSLAQRPYGIEIHKSVEGAERGVILFHYLQLCKRGGSSRLIESKSSHNASWNSQLGSLNQSFSTFGEGQCVAVLQGPASDAALKPRQMFSCFFIEVLNNMRTRPTNIRSGYLIMLYLSLRFIVGFQTLCALAYCF